MGGGVADVEFAVCNRVGVLVFQKNLSYIIYFAFNASYRKVRFAIML